MAIDFSYDITIDRFRVKKGVVNLKKEINKQNII